MDQMSTFTMDQSSEPCSSWKSSSRENFGDYVLMVQCLIERCLLIDLSRDECVYTLARRARIDPAVTLAVWKGLEKQNPAFFEEYSRRPHNSETRKARRAQQAAHQQLQSAKMLQYLDAWQLPCNGT
ncbi:hypothetical protein CLOM_g20593 [Closterium sp. NIES-68]|nr:hypothetical protein CLOM_g20593 [Closterium sp. NIES-68]GJP84059.1 hypothetical protein CLOP_g14150 [Closterium sp. NIES-67]